MTSDHAPTDPTPVPPARHLATLVVATGRPEQVVDAPLNTPVTFASTYVGRHDTGQGELGYGRTGNPTWEALETTIGVLEGGQAVTFSSGMAAAQAVLELFGPGTVMVLPAHCYLGVAAAVDHRATRDGWVLRRVDVADTAAVVAAAQGADLVWLESPTNPMIEVADLPAIGSALQGTTVLVVDNTFATPLLQRPLEHGFGIVLHAATKFIAGHSDALLGALVVPDEDADTLTRLRDIRSHSGSVPGTMEAYLALRGVRTLAVRLERMQHNAAVLAERLQAHPAVRAVRYPGLPGDPGHETAAATMDGVGSLISVELADAATADAFVDATSLWVFATSLGGVESTLERRRRWAGELPPVPEGLVRLSVGIEHVEDLWADLAQSLDALA